VIHPTVTDILKTIDATMTAKVMPSITDLDGQSAATTIRHLLRLVLVRTEEEGQTLLDEINQLRRLLPGVREYLQATDAGVEQRQRIDTALAEGDEDDTRYPRLDTLAERLGGLREALYQALKALQALRRERHEQPEYRAVRAAIRDYIVWQNEQERKLIAPAFYGQGPRR
jgi:hypothetical protein